MSAQLTGSSGAEQQRRRAHRAAEGDVSGRAAGTIDENGKAVVPLEDAVRGQAIYSRRILHYALLGALLGALAVGFGGYALATGGIAYEGLGQWAAAGPAPAAFAGAGVGVALAALAGSLVAVYRMPKR